MPLFPVKKELFEWSKQGTKTIELRKGIEITGGLAGVRDLGIKVKKNYGQEVRLSSLFCVPMTVMVSALLLPLWILLFNTGFACASCIDDVTRFPRDRNSKKATLGKHTFVHKRYELISLELQPYLLLGECINILYCQCVIDFSENVS